MSPRTPEQNAWIAACAEQYARARDDVKQSRAAIRGAYDVLLAALRGEMIDLAKLLEERKAPAGEHHDEIGGL